MKCKYYFVLLVLFICGFGFSQAPNFHVNGQVEGLNNNYIYFSYLGEGNQRKWDSTVIKNNKFTFSGQITESKNGFVTTLKKNRVDDLNNPKISERIFIDQNSNIEINIENPSNFHTAKISGSNSFDKFMKYKDLVSQNTSKEIVKRYILQNSNSYVGLYILRQNLDSFSYNDLNRFYENLSADLKNNEYGKHLFEYKSKLENSIVGKKAINFSADDLHKNKLTLSDFEGNYVLLDFWASWCKPCRENNPRLINIFNKYKKEDFVIIGIAQDGENDKKWKKAIEKDKTEFFYHINDVADAITNLYSIQFVPVQILIDKNGTIIHRYDDVFESSDKLENDLEGIFKY